MKTAVYWEPNTPYEDTTLHAMLANRITGNFCINELRTLEPTSNLVILGQPNVTALNSVCGIFLYCYL